MEHFYAVLGAWAQTHGLWGVALFMAGESGGLPVPTGLGFVAAQGMIDHDLCAWWEAFLWIVGGHMVGAGFTYYLGIAGDSALARYFSHKPPVVRARTKMQDWYARYGPLAILFGRLIGQVRPWASFVAGLARVPLGPFLLWTLLGTAVYSAVTMWVTEVGWKLWMQYPAWRVPAVVALLVLFYGLPLYHVARRLYLRRRARQRAAASVSGE